MKRTQDRKLVREINQLFKNQEEVVLGTNDIQAFLSNGKTVDSIDVMEVIRQIARKHRWTAFVYDHGALVSFKKNGVARLNGIAMPSAA